MHAKAPADLREVCCYIEHAAVVVAHEPHPRVRQGVNDLCGLEPVLDLSPACIVLMQRARDLMKRQTETAENVCDLWNRAGAAVGKPLARLLACGCHGAEPVVVQR